MDAFLQFLYWLIYQFIQIIQPMLVPLCFVLAWGIVLLAIWNVVSALRDGVSRAQKMHQIPCANCRYFTNNHLLKCPVHPETALSEAAINCRDYESDDPLAAFHEKQLKG